MNFFAILDENENVPVCEACLLKTIGESFLRQEINEAEYQGRKVSLNKPFRTPGGPKKFSVYVKDPSSGNIRKISFGDPNMEIKRDSAKNRKSFRARHKCSQKKDKTTAGYWSCYQWRKGSNVVGEAVIPKRMFHYEVPLVLSLTKHGLEKDEVTKRLRAIPGVTVVRSEGEVSKADMYYKIMYHIKFALRNSFNLKKYISKILLPNIENIPNVTIHKRESIKMLEK